MSAVSLNPLWNKSMNLWYIINFNIGRRSRFDGGVVRGSKEKGGRELGGMKIERQHGEGRERMERGKKLEISGEKEGGMMEAERGKIRRK